MTAASPKLDQAHSLPTFLDDRSMAIPMPPPDAAHVTAETSPTGRYGVALAEIDFAAETSLSCRPSENLIGVFVCPPAPTKHTMAGKRSYHMSETGLICVCPANADYVTEYHARVKGATLAQCSPLAMLMLHRARELPVRQRPFALASTRIGARVPTARRRARRLRTVNPSSR